MAMPCGSARPVSSPCSSRSGASSFGVLAEDDDRRVVLGGQEHLVPLVVHGDAERPVRGAQRPFRRRVPLGAVSEDDERIHGVVVRREDVAGLRIDMDAGLELDEGAVPGQRPLRRARLRAGRGVLESIVHQDLEEVLVGEDDFVALRIDGNCGKPGVLVLDLARRRSDKHLRLFAQRLRQSPATLTLAGALCPLDRRRPHADAVVDRERLHPHEAAVRQHAPGGIGMSLGDEKARRRHCADQTSCPRASPAHQSSHASPPNR